MFWTASCYVTTARCFAKTFFLRNTFRQRVDVGWNLEKVFCIPLGKLHHSVYAKALSDSSGSKGFGARIANMCQIDHGYVLQSHFVTV